MAQNTAQAVAEVDKAMANVNKGIDKKEEMIMTMAPYANWGEYLVPAPLSIALLGELILISGDADFSLEEKPPKDGFQVLRYPSSFRACLVQVSNAGWDAFNEAHTNMDQIRLQSANVEVHVRNAVKFLVGGSDQEVKVMVPMALNNVSRIADDCLSLVTSVEDKFVHVMKLTAELLEACTNAKGQYEDHLKDAEIAIKVAKEHEKIAREQKENASKQYKEMEKEVKECQEKFKEAVASVPSGWSLIGMSVVDGITSAFTGVLNGMTTSLVGKSPAKMKGKSPSRMKKKMKKNAYDEDEDYDEPKSGQESAQQKANRKIYSTADEILVQVTALASLVDGYDETDEDWKPDWNELRGDALRFVQQSLKGVMSRLQKQTNTSVKVTADKLCRDGLKICEQLQKLGRSVSSDKGDFKASVERIQKLQSDAFAFEAKAKLATGSNPSSAKNPQASKVQQYGSNSGVVNAVLQNTQMKIETSKELLKHNQGRYDVACEALKESNEKLGQILADLSKHEMKKIDFEEIRKVLIRGMKALAKVREQWGKMVRFFQMLSNIIKSCLHTSLNQFVESTNAGREMTLGGLTLSALMRDVIYEQAFHANKISYLVHVISSTYVQVSDKHLMDGITCLGKLVALDPVQDRTAIQQEKARLLSQCQMAQRAIRDLVNEKRAEYDSQVEKRLAKINSELQSVLPPPKSTVAIKQVEETTAVVKKTLASAQNDDLDQWC